MADQINVTETRSRSPWPWIIGIVVILIAIWAFTQMGDNNTDDVNINVPAGTAAVGDTGGDAGTAGGNDGGSTAPPQ